METTSPTDGHAATIHVRVPGGLLAALDAYENKGGGGRSNAVRELLGAALGRLGFFPIPAPPQTGTNAASRSKENE